MTDERDGIDARERRVDAAIADFLAAEDRGDAPDRRAFLARHPDLAPQLEAFFADHDRAGRLAGPFADGAAAATQFYGGRPSSLEFAGLRQVGDYELLEEIGRGGMGVVFKARQHPLNRIVALKMILAGLLASPADIRRFHTEAEAVAELDHPNIVPVFEVGEHQGYRFFSMKWIDGGNLAEQVPRYRADLREAAQLVVTIARAMHYAHQRRILHRDLKPSNILLDAAGQPHISDFGLAQREGTPSELTASGAILGTAPYMAPEQASGRKGAVTTATDVYGLGAILYALLTGRSPFGADTLLETIRQVQERDPERPGALNPAVDRDLERVCLKCLEKDPQRRYGSADALANDLGRWLRGEPVLARPVTGAERLLRWGRRHPAAAGLTAGAIGLLIVVAVAALGIAQDLADRLQEEVLRDNVYAAQNVASTVLWEFQDVSELVLRLAQDPDLQRALERGDRTELQRVIADLDPSDARVTNWNVFNREGRQEAVWPPRGDDRELDFSWRDYFQGARLRQREVGLASVYVSRVYRSKTDNYYKLAVAVPVHGRAGFIGVVTATINTMSQLGSLSLSDERRKFVLVGRLDPNREDGRPAAGGPPEHLILVHPEYDPGQVPVPVPDERIRQVARLRPGDAFQLPPSHRVDAPEYRDSAYRDPLYKDRWLAGFAQVGNTELVVIVQQRYSEVVEPYATRVRELVLLGGAALALMAILLGSSLWYGVRRVAGGKSPGLPATAGK